MSLKDSIINNTGRLMAGGLITLFSMLFIWAITPVREIVAVPRILETIQKDFEQRQTSLIASLDKQRRSDSLMFLEISQLQTALEKSYCELVIIQSKVNVIRDEFPLLHQRFNNIEKAIALAEQNIKRPHEVKEFGIGVKKQ